jgi:hypothetical protein
LWNKTLLPPPERPVAVTPFAALRDDEALQKLLAREA